MRTNLTLLIAVAAVLATSPAVAAGPGARIDQTGSITKVRYTMTPANGGFIRMDTETGVLSFCSSKSGDMRCSLVPDDRIVLEKEVELLREQNKELRDDNKRLEDMVLGTDKKPGSKSARKPIFKLPSEKEVDQALGYVERMYKKFRDKLRELEDRNDGSKGTEL